MTAAYDETKYDAMISTRPDVGSTRHAATGWLHHASQRPMTSSVGTLWSRQEKRQGGGPLFAGKAQNTEQ